MFKIFNKPSKNILNSSGNDQNRRCNKKQFNLLVEWTNYCNINCNICPIDSPQMRPKGHMRLGLWEKIIRDCMENGHFINWVHHLGEPLLWKHFEKGMEIWERSGLSGKGHISTNGILLDDEKIRILKKTKIDFIRICIDTLRPEVYQKIRNNDMHAVVVENVKKLIEKAPDLSIQLQLMKTRLNYDEKPEDFYEFFGTPKNISVFYSMAINLGKDHEFSMLPEKQVEPKYCNKVDYEHCIIGWDGTVGLCCPDYRIANRLGSINTAKISEVFDSGYANKVRTMIKAGDYSRTPACKTCSMDHMKPLIQKTINNYDLSVS